MSHAQRFRPRQPQLRNSRRHFPGMFFPSNPLHLHLTLSVSDRHEQRCRLANLFFTYEEFVAIPVRVKHLLGPPFALDIMGRALNVSEIVEMVVGHAFGKSTVACAQVRRAGLGQRSHWTTFSIPSKKSGHLFMRQSGNPTYNEYIFASSNSKMYR